MAQSTRPLIFGKYCLLERVSVGGMAEVFRARPFNAPSFRRFLAVKRILPNLAEDDEFISMFVDEAKVSVQLNHRNVCQIYELGRLQGSYYIVMEYIPGKNLLQMQNRFRQEKRIMSVTQAAFLTMRICEGLDYSHRKTTDDGRPLNIIHRDVSPQNILVSYDGEVKVIDFGIARAATRNEQTQVGVLKGKFGYMSPEQANADDIDRRSDIFAVGTLFWEMLTARRLFHGESDYATLDLVRAAQIEPPSVRNSRVPPEIDAIVMKALAADREQRYQWASELAADLRTFLDGVRPPYTERTLSQWMASSWREDHEAERRKVDEFSRFVTPDDVIRYLDEEVDELDDLEMESEAAEGDDEDEATRVFQASDASASPAPASGDVLAENDEENLATVVMREEDLEGMRVEVETGEAGEAGEGGEGGAPTPVPASAPPAASSPQPPRRSGDTAPAIRLDRVPRPTTGAQPPVSPEALFQPDAPARAARTSFELPAVHVAARRRGLPPWLLAVIVLLVLGLAGVAGWVAWRPRPAPVGQLVVEVTPGDGVQAFVNSQALSGPPPWTVTDVTPGTAFVELRRDGYETILESVAVEAGATVRFVRTLTPAAVDGRVVLTLSEPGAQVYLDGSLVGGQGAQRTFSATARTPHVVEVYLPGHFVETWEFTLDGGTEFARTATLRPVLGSIRVDPEPDGRVSVGGLERGASGEIVVDGLDVRRPWEIEIQPAVPGYLPLRTTTVFDTYYDIRMQPRLRRLGETSPDETGGFGWLTTGEAETWMRVLVDGRDTGLVTPITAEADLPGLALKTGTRRITFARAGRERTVEIVIGEGQTLHVDPPAAP